MTTDEPDEQLDPLSPADEAKVRALLAGARETEPTPAGVAARLDDVLAGLATERAALDPGLDPGLDPVPADNVVPLTRTRRHRVVAVLGAAAAVAVLGLGIGTFFQQSGGDDMGDAGSDSALAERGEDAHATAPVESGAKEAEPGDSEDNVTTTKTDVHAGDRAFVVRSRQLTRDLARIQEIVLPDPGAADYHRGLVHAPKGFACPTGVWGAGILVGVRYDGDPAFVAFSEPMGDSQVVEVLQCGTGDLLRSTTLPTGG